MANPVYLLNSHPEAPHKFPDIDILAENSNHTSMN